MTFAFINAQRLKTDDLNVSIAEKEDSLSQLMSELTEKNSQIQLSSEELQTTKQQISEEQSKILHLEEKSAQLQGQLDELHTQVSIICFWSQSSFLRPYWLVMIRDVDLSYFSALFPIANSNLTRG